MATIKKFEDLEMWQVAREICKKLNIYIEANDKFRDYGLKNQIYNSSGSAMDNIAEGFERNGNKEFRQFLSIAKASAGECRSQIFRLKDKEAITEDQFNDLYKDLLNLSKQISGFINYINSTEMKGSKFSEPEIEYLPLHKPNFES